MQCGLAFSSGRAGSCREYRARHALAASVRTCRGCGKIFSSKGRLSRHVSHARACLAIMESTPCAVDEGEDGHAQAPPMKIGAGCNSPVPNSLVDVPVLFGALQRGLVVGTVAAVPGICSTVRLWRDSTCDSKARAVADEILRKLHPAVANSRNLDLKDDFTGQNIVGAASGCNLGPRFMHPFHGTSGTTAA